MLAEFDINHLPMLLVVGLSLFVGGLGARLFQKMRIPQVVGYITIGLLIGRMGLKILNSEAIAQMRLFNYVALGVIGFMIGGELKKSVFQRYGRQFMAILFGEGLTAFVFVSALVTLGGYLFTQNFATSMALGLILGAISSATAPAATVDVLWEYKTRGPLTTSVFAIVALDDGLALVLYGLAASFAKHLIGTDVSGRGLLASVGTACYELVGAAILGGIIGILLNFLLRFIKEHDKNLIFTLGALIVTLGLSMLMGVDVILSAMALGTTLTNLAPRRSQETFRIIERFAPPIYVLFFVIVGARLTVGDMPAWMWVVAVLYVIGRTAGKMLGAFTTARLTKSPQAVQKYLGLCLFSQAGVAIGLAIISSENFTGKYAYVGNAVIMIVTATTFLVQIIGPPCVKLAVARAGEIGLNVTREDLIASYKVGDVMIRDPLVFRQATPFNVIMQTINETDYNTYPVVDDGNHLLGVITLNELKGGLGNIGLAQLLLAYDLMQPPSGIVQPNVNLGEAMTKMREEDFEYLIVADYPDETGKCKLIGLVELRKVDRLLNRELIRRRDAADGQS
ncbi:MAG TPA: cation:proton antiporter [Phycisphaerae bacterium]|nr:cation:proton antiporter [Phycisphaerae bacterium]HPS53611.1 cation:proton antiporter [Phycisphaerae bacterium]